MNVVLENRAIVAGAGGDPTPDSSVTEQASELARFQRQRPASREMDGALLVGQAPAVDGGDPLERDVDPVEHFAHRHQALDASVEIDEVSGNPPGAAVVARASRLAANHSTESLDLANPADGIERGGKIATELAAGNPCAWPGLTGPG